MPTTEALQRKISSARELQSIVKTMKALAAVSIHQYERAVSSLSTYQQVLELSLQVLLHHTPNGLPIRPTAAPPCLVIFGSDQGMCGRFNEQLAAAVLDHLQNHLSQANERSLPPRLITVGTRLAARLADDGYATDSSFSVPSSVSGITPMVQTIVQKLEEWRSHSAIGSIYVFHHRFLGGSSYRPKTFQLYPLDADWLNHLRHQPWRSRQVPMITLPPEQLFSALFQQLFFLGLFRACAESLASENASRLAAMQVAEKNIQERLAQIQSDYNQHRQTLVTEELLDIIAGFEALQSDS
ncbi:F0F1 ATP synthase subunit gamma [Leptolyngbya sp. CCY15150]|uniref:F0F1 ATP synthase subunit gamma n=1 Tax=Leptolyngbya sp. CCY15150 TaxID=2767772 RepID=UPI0019528FA4|nr:F0F1 ATP synthase subunit gamma [Leptolyngbya sp. CCY15150]